MSIRSLGYIGLAVKDAAAWDAFATGVLGLMPGEARGETRRYRLDEFAWRIAVERGETDDLAYVGLEVAGRAELEALAARLTNGGVAVGIGGPERLAERGVLGLISCQDPDGLAVEIFYGPTLRTERPFVSPAGVSGFVTGEQGLGHIVLTTANIAAARHFYQDQLGFRLSDIILMEAGPQSSFEMEFFHCPRPGACTISWSRRRALTPSASLSSGRSAPEPRSPPVSVGTPTTAWSRSTRARPPASRSSSVSARWRWTTPAGASRAMSGQVAGATGASRAEPGFI
jgi:catechol 2,3-dioxygenase-like lactoylglutathione lyase family enzyme